VIVIDALLAYVKAKRLTTDWALTTLMRHDVINIFGRDAEPEAKPLTTPSACMFYWVCCFERCVGCTKTDATLSSVVGLPDLHFSL
jgi:hypothetical protein